MAVMMGVTEVRTCVWQHTTATLDPVNLQEGVGEYGQDQAQINLAHCPKALRS